MRRVFGFLKDQRGGLAGDVAKSAAAIAFLSLIAANWLSHSTADLDRSGLAQVASNVTKGLRDPMTTGSVRKLDEIKFDPCVDQRKR